MFNCSLGKWTKIENLHGFLNLSVFSVVLTEGFEGFFFQIK